MVIKMNDSMTISLSDEGIEALKKIVSTTPDEYYGKCVFPDGTEKTFTFKKVYRDSKFYKKRVGKRYKIFIKHSKFLTMEGVCYND